MNHQITEGELRQLQSVRGQLGLVEGLLTATGARGDLFDAEDLYDFLAAQTAALLGIIKGIEQRDELLREEPQLKYFHLLHMIRILRGKANYTSKGAEDRITEALARCAAIDVDMQGVFSEWTEALVDIGEAQRIAAKSSQVNPAKNRKRETLARVEA